MAGPEDYEKSARQFVNTALVAAGTNAAKVAIAVSQQIAHAARSTKDTREAIVAAVRGGISAAAMGGADVPDLSVRVLESLSNMSLMMRVSPEDLMSWVMEGIAGAASLMTPETRDHIQNKIDEKYMGAGQVYYGFVQTALKKG